MNEEIRATEVRLVDQEGNQMGVKPVYEAMRIARARDLDLVEVAPQARPPVCRIMDYGKFKFDAAQKARESRRRSTSAGVKEMKYRPKIGPGDFDTKTRQVERFLSEGHRVKVTIMFRGREANHPELGMRILDRITDHLDGSAKVESPARIDGRNRVMVLAPEKKPQEASARKVKPKADVLEPAAPVVPEQPEGAVMSGPGRDG